jgi:phosphoglycolate phosphatase
MGSIKVGSKRYTCKALCLDKDGLLFDSESFWMELLRAREQVLASVLDENSLTLWRSLSGVMSEGIDRQGPFALAHPRDEMVIAASVIYLFTRKSWDVCWKIACERFALADNSLDWKSALRPLPGFPHIIQEAKKAGVPVAIVTSDDAERTEYSLSLFGVRDQVDLICTPLEVGRGKPYPDMLLHVAERFGCSPSEIVMIGDSLVDVEMAKNAGSVGIGIPHKEARHLFNGYLTVNSLLDIEVIAD